MAADLSRDMLAGAQLVNMGWQRQERMMQLRAQAAAQQMQERQTAAQVEMLLAHRDLYRQQVNQKLTDEADMLGYQNLVNEDINVQGKDPWDASIERLVPLSRANPALAERVAGALEKQAQTKMMIPKMQAEMEAKEASKQADLSRAKYWEAKASQPGGVGQQGISPMRRYANEISAATDVLEAAQETGDETAVAKAQSDLDNLVKAMNKLHPDRSQTLKGQVLKEHETLAYKALLENPKDADLNRAYRNARKELEDYVSEGKSTATPSSAQSKYEVGKMYRDSKGNKAIYQADGTWKEIK